MARTAAKFTQADAARVMRAIKDAGGDLRLVFERDGRMIVEPMGEAAPQTDEADSPSEALDIVRRPRL